MEYKGIVLSLIFIFVAVMLLIIYWFIPFSVIKFRTEPSNFNFNVDFGSNNTNLEGMQFYKHMRYQNPSISYLIENDCTLQKKDDARRAFEIISNKTILNFYETASNEEINIACSEKNKMDGEMFIAGEGGPSKASKVGSLHVIFNGKVLLIKDSECPKPNIAIHEILHALGFNHSKNPYNIMYNISKCEQTIGDDIPLLINKLYAIPSYADLSIENVSASMRGKYLDMNMSVRNIGLKKSAEADLIVYANEEVIKEIKLAPMEIGRGLEMSLTNLWIPTIKTPTIELFVNSSFNELEKRNNKASLEAKEQD